MAVTKGKKRKTTKKAEPALPTFDQWIALDVEACIASLDINVEIAPARYGGQALMVTIGEPFIVPDDRYYHRVPIDLILDEADLSGFGERGELMSIDDGTEEWMGEIICNAALAALQTDENMAKVRETVHAFVAAAHRAFRRREQDQIDRLNERATNIIERAGAEKADIVAIGDTSKGNRRYYESDVTSYKIMRRGRDGNWQEQETSYSSQAMVKQYFPTSVIAFRSPQGKCTLYTPGKPKKKTRAELEAELAALRAKLGEEG